MIKYAMKNSSTRAGLEPATSGLFLSNCFAKLSYYKKNPECSV